MQKVDYSKLMAEDDDDDEDEAGAGDTKAFSSDDEFVAAKNGGGGGDDDDEIASIDTPVKKPAPKRKLAPKAAAEAKPKAASGKRTKKAISDSDSSDYGARNVSTVFTAPTQKKN